MNTDMIKCEYCNRKYKTIEKYQKHIKTHNEQIDSQSIEKISVIRVARTIEKHEQPKYICPCSNCQRKYKTETNLREHIEKFHYYETRKGNYNFTFTYNQRIKIYELMLKYEDIVISKENTIEIVEKLIPQESQPSNEKITQMLNIHGTFLKKINQSNLLETCNWKDAITNFGKFLSLGLPYYDTNFNPSLEIDFVWHAVMQNLEFYRELCEEKAQCLVPHCATERTEEQDQQRYKYFLDVFEHRYKHSISHISEKTSSSIKEFMNEEIKLKKEKDYKEEVEKAKWEASRKKYYDFWKSFWKEVEIDRTNPPGLGDEMYYRELAAKGFKGKKLDEEVRKTHNQYNQYWRGSSC